MYTINHWKVLFKNTDMLTQIAMPVVRDYATAAMMDLVELWATFLLLVT